MKLTSDQKNKSAVHPQQILLLWAHIHYGNRVRSAWIFTDILLRIWVRNATVKFTCSRKSVFFLCLLYFSLFILHCVRHLRQLKILHEILFEYISHTVKLQAYSDSRHTSYKINLQCVTIAFTATAKITVMIPPYLIRIILTCFINCYLKYEGINFFSVYLILPGVIWPWDRLVL